jgi:division protein CdvB (Snf7/Vps24/ESCRT-III family)
MNLVQVAQVMDKFTEKVEDFQILEETVNNTMEKTTANLVVKDDVDDLIRQVADEYNLQLEELLPAIAAKTSTFLFIFLLFYFVLYIFSIIILIIFGCC